jgi:hypothetical protein
MFTKETPWLDPLHSILQKTDISLHIERLVDSRVASIFESLRSLGRATDATDSDAQILTESDLHAGIGAAQYQLFQLEDGLGDILSECLRVTMLAFLTTTLQLPKIKIRYHYAAKRLRELCLAIESSTPQMREMMFWILMMGATAFFDPEELWLREKWQLDVLPITKDLQWEQARQLLKRYIWIDHCNTIAGQYIFKVLNRGLDIPVHITENNNRDS